MPEAQRLRGTPQQRGVAGGVGGRQQHQPLRRLGQRPHPPQVVVLELPGDRGACGTREAAGQLRLAHPVAPAPAAPAGCRGSRRRAGRGPARPDGPGTAAASSARASSSVEPLDASASGRPGNSRLVGRLPDREQRAATDSASSRRPTNPSTCADGFVQPLGVVDQAHQRPLRRRPRPAGSAPPDPTRNRSGALPVASPNATRSACCLGLRQRGRGRRASARTAGAAPRTAAPARTPRRRSERPGSPTPGARSSAAARSCRSPPHPGGPAPRSRRHGRGPAADRGPGARVNAPGRPALVVAAIRATRRTSDRAREHPGATPCRCRPDSGHDHPARRGVRGSRGDRDRGVAWHRPGDRPQAGEPAATPSSSTTSTTSARRSRPSRRSSPTTAPPWPSAPTSRTNWTWSGSSPRRSRRSAASTSSSTPSGAGSRGSVAEVDLEEFDALCRINTGA